MLELRVGMGKKYIFTNLIGCFVFDEQVKSVDKVVFNDVNDYYSREKHEQKLAEKHKAEKAEGKVLLNILESFNDKKYFNEFQRRNILITKKHIRESVKQDQMIIQAVHLINEIDKAVNILSKKLRDWYEIYNPEFSNKIADHERFSEIVIVKNKKDLLKELGIKEDEAMGGEIEKEDLEMIKDLAKQTNDIYKLRKQTEEYIDKKMDKVAPNIKAIAGSLIGAKLIDLAGSLERLMKFPASTLQLLGAEKALFRHMRNKKIKPPKYGILHEHPLIQKMKLKDHGRAARALADKISIASKVDFFKGDFIGDKLKNEIEKRFS